MKLKVINDDGSVKCHDISDTHLKDESLSGDVRYIGTQSKEENALNIYKAYFSKAKVILLDETNTFLVDEMQRLNIVDFSTNQKQKTIFDREDFTFMYYTSGSTGMPTGALKTLDNIISEVESVTKLLQSYSINKVIVTVPFIHLYGTLFGLMYPLLNEIDIVFKEHFLPHDLLSIADPHTMVVTTPLYIKALNTLTEAKDLSQTLFVSSTAPLDEKSICSFNEKFSADIMQIYGSTETGGIAYKINTNPLWKPFTQVDIYTNQAQELEVKSPFVSRKLYANSFIDTKGKIKTFDYIEEEKGGFTLIGRSAKIFKLAGKRYSTVHIEHILESISDIHRALVFVVLKKDSLRGECLDITLESSKTFTKREIKKLLQDNLSNLKFAIELHHVDKIVVNQLGKKLRI